MSGDFWTIHEHIIQASHIRGFSRGIRDEQTGRLRLAVKQYVPKGRQVPRAGDITLIMVPGVGVSKELCEPFFDELLGWSLPIRAVWSMDPVHHAASYVLNEGIIGDEPNWFDTSRDLLHMINHFQELMPPPLVAVGFSWGCVPIVSLAVFHPRLFAGVIFMEPTFVTQPAIRKIDRTDKSKDRSHRAVAIAKRRELWSSLDDARTSLRRNPHFGAFDSRVFERVVKYDLRPAPPGRCSEIGSPDAVTSTTPVSLQIGIMMRPDPPFAGFPEAVDLRNRPEDIDTIVIEGFYRGEVLQVYRDLPYILPATFYLWGSRSFGDSTYAREFAERTGTGYGGNGGIASGRVQSKTMSDTGHNIPLDKPREAAEAVVPWLQKELERWDNEAREREKQPGFETTRNSELMQRIAKL